jgi:hypothetical protein
MIGGMLYLAPDVTPRERLTILETSARHAATRDEVRELARTIRARVPRATQVDLARAILATVARPRYQGAPSTDPSIGQWLDTNVPETVAWGGDCLDRTHAVLALAFALGLDGFAVWVTEPDEVPLDHVAARLRIDGLWYWADAIARPAVLGVAPRGVAMQSARGPFP